MKDYNCYSCIHQYVCPAYDVTMTECEHYLSIVDVFPVMRCKNCPHYRKEDTRLLYEKE